MPLKVTTPRRIVAAQMLVHGSGLLLVPHRYTSGSYAVMREIAPFRLWGVAWVAAALLLLFRRSPLTLAFAIGTSAAWAAANVATVFTGQTQAPTGCVFPLGFVALLLYSSGRPTGTA